MTPFVTIPSRIDAAPRMIFLHGGPGLDHSYFLPAFGGGNAPYEAVFYTQGSSGALGVDGLISELSELVTKRSDRPVFLFGHSFGASLILEYVRRHDERGLAGLALCSWIHDKKDWLDDYCRRFRLSPRELKNKTLKDDAEFKAATLAASDRYYFTEAFRETGRALWNTVGFNSAVYNDISREFFDDFDATDVVRSLKLPVLSLAGAADEIVGLGHVRRGCALNPGIESTEIKDAGHFPFVENPEETHAALERFLTLSGGINPTRSPRT